MAVPVVRSSVSLRPGEHEGWGDQSIAADRGRRHRRLVLPVAWHVYDISERVPSLGVRACVLIGLATGVTAGWLRGRPMLAQVLIGAAGAVMAAALARLGGAVRLGQSVELAALAASLVGAVIALSVADRVGRCQRGHDL